MPKQDKWILSKKKKPTEVFRLRQFRITTFSQSKYAVFGSDLRFFIICSQKLGNGKFGWDEILKFCTEFLYFCYVVFIFSCIFSSHLWRTFLKNTLYMQCFNFWNCFWTSVPILLRKHMFSMAWLLKNHQTCHDDFKS